MNDEVVLPMGIPLRPLNLPPSGNNEWTAMYDVGELERRRGGDVNTFDRLQLKVEVRATLARWFADIDFIVALVIRGDSGMHAWENVLTGGVKWRSDVKAVCTQPPPGGEKVVLQGYKDQFKERVSLSDQLKEIYTRITQGMAVACNDESRITSPLMWAWYKGGSGHVIPKSGKDGQLTYSMYIDLPQDPTWSSLEVQLCGQYFNHRDSDGQIIRLLNLPGEFTIIHGKDEGMTEIQWKKLRDTRNVLLPRDMITMTMGPSTTGKCAKYELISWIDKKGSIWRMYNGDARRMNNVLLRDGLATTMLDEVPVPVVTRWRQCMYKSYVHYSNE
jgi:hypothetical protein